VSTSLCRSVAARGLASGLLLLALGLGGCAAPLQSEALLEKMQSLYPAPVELTDVRFFPQEKFQCGPAALASILTFTGVDIDDRALTPQIFLPAREGSLQLEIVAATRRYGRVAYVLQPKLADLLAEVSTGNPVLVLQNLGVSWLPQWHYAVVVGFDIREGDVILRSGLEKRHVLPFSVFERTWRRSGYWALVALPPDHLPRTAEELRYLQAVVPFERTGKWNEAVIAYTTALTRWPQSLGAGIGLGNSRYALGDLVGAAQAFRAATEAHPDSGDAFNNLAHVLAAIGKLDQAEVAAQRAVTLGGPNLATYQRTVEEILARRSGAKPSPP